MSNKLISIGEASKRLGISIDSLRRWDKTHRLPSIRSGPRGHRYYSLSDITLYLRNESSLAQQWATKTVGVEPPPDAYCQTRDVFQARLEKLQSVLSHTVSLQLVSLLCAVAGEIGNNSFDHNLGNWPDIPGIYFSYDRKNSTIVLADRGQGILATLKRVKPSLTNASDALRVAFTETISGRQPEARGNGLKFVRSVVVKSPFILNFQTGDAWLCVREHDKDVAVTHADTYMRGCFVTIEFESYI